MVHLLSVYVLISTSRKHCLIVLGMVLAASLLSFALPMSGGIQSTARDPRIDNLLEPIRQKYKLPALAVATVKSDGSAMVGAVGVRKVREKTAVTVDDQWHLGSDTKSITAVLIAMLVEQGKLTWDTTIEQIFPELVAGGPRR